MGVDYRVWVIPQQRAFRPSADQFARLPNALRDGNWAPMPDAPGQPSQVLELLPGDGVKGKSLLGFKGLTSNHSPPVGWNFIANMSL
jgi:hypothetical protein